MNRYRGFEHLLQAKAEDIPDAPAFLYEQNGVKQTLSYQTFREQALQRSLELASENKKCLGVLCDGSLPCILTIFGAVLSGLQTVLLDENASTDLLREQIVRTDIDLLWSSDEELLEELEAENETGDRETGDGPLSPGPSDINNHDPGQKGDKGPSPVSSASKILFFTSGTTNAGKAVVLTDASLMSSAWNGSCMLPLSAEDVLLCMLPLNHVFGFVCSLLWGLQCGACVALGRGPRHYADDPSFFEPTVISLVPMLLGFLLKHLILNPQLRTVLVGAGDCPSSLLQAATASGIRVSFGYGLTETSSGIAISISGDPYAMEICPDPKITFEPDGEILIEAPSCMMQGYYKDPEATAEVLKDGVLHTGDLGRLDEEGRLHIIGRKKEILVLPDGTKIFLPEYEQNIRQILGEVDLAVVEKDGAPILVIFGTHMTRRGVFEKLTPLMQQYPRGQQLKDVLFITEPIPRTATGKVQRWVLQTKIRRKINQDTGTVLLS